MAVLEEMMKALQQELEDKESQWLVALLANALAKKRTQNIEAYSCL